MHTHIPAVWWQRNIHISTDFRRPLCRVGNSFYGLPMNSSTALQRRHRSRARPIVPPLLHSHELPGPMSLNRLSRGGTVCSLDGHSGYWSEHGDTLYGRALIVHNIIPSATVACMRTALWVWMGGLFPETVDVLSGSHYRTMRHGRPIRVFARRVDRDHVQTLGDLNITSPLRTACDIATMANRRPDAAVFADRVADLMHTYRFTPDDCAAILGANPCATTVPHAKAFLNTVRMYYEERHHARVRERQAMMPLRKHYASRDERSEAKQKTQGDNWPEGERGKGEREQCQYLQG